MKDKYTSISMYVRERKGEEDKRVKKERDKKLKKSMPASMHEKDRQKEKEERGRESKKAEDKRGNNGERKDVESILTCVCMCMRKKW